MKSYTKAILILIAVSITLFFASKFFYEQDLYSGVTAIALLWFILVIVIFVINLKEFIKEKMIALNVLNVVLTLFILAIFFTHVMDSMRGLDSFMAVPSFALIPAIIGIIQQRK